MKKALLVLILFVLSVSAGWKDSTVLNWNGYLDTASIAGILVDGTKKYTSGFVLGDGEDLIVICKVSDTAETGFENDSVHFEWGIQTGDICLDTGATLDTCWSYTIVIDTMDAGAYGTYNNQTMGTDQTITYTLGGHDTTNLDGYVYQKAKPELSDIWDCIVRGWVNSLGDPSKDAAGLDIQFQFIQKQFTPIRQNNVKIEQFICSNFVVRERM